MSDNEYVSKNKTEAAFLRIYRERALWKRELVFTRALCAVLLVAAVAGWWPR